jgi:hypothetical protein
MYATFLIICNTLQLGLAFTPPDLLQSLCVHKYPSTTYAQKHQYGVLALPQRQLESQLNLNLFTQQSEDEDGDTDCINETSLRERYPNDYLITDSIFLPSSSRPKFSQAISNPRDLLAMPLIAIGLVISIFNINGIYNEQYLQLESIAIALGFISTAAYMIQIITGYNISNNIRRGIIDDATVNLYAAGYTGAVSWLALRTSESCPSWLYSFDHILPIASVGVFVLSLLAPFFTLVGDASAMVTFTRSLSIQKDGNGNGNDNDNQSKSQQGLHPPELSPTELLRARGLLAIGVLGCVFAPDALSFALGGQEWWDRVYALHPSQRTLESSTSLFALFAVEASMISHRVGKTGASCYRDIVPAFVVVCSVLAILPCVCALHWLGDDVSYFSFYRE